VARAGRTKPTTEDYVWRAWSWTEQRYRTKSRDTWLSRLSVHV